MKNQLQPNGGLEYIPYINPPNSTENKGEEEKKIVLQISDDLINEAPTAQLMEDLQGYRDYDLGNLHYISNTGLANIVDLLKTSLKRGIEVHFLNASEKIKNKIRAMGMDNFLNFT
jgi:hypothetical protein